MSAETMNYDVVCSLARKAWHSQRRQHISGDWKAKEDRYEGLGEAQPVEGIFQQLNMRRMDEGMLAVWRYLQEAEREPSTRSSCVFLEAVEGGGCNVNCLRALDY